MRKATKRIVLCVSCTWVWLAAGDAFQPLALDRVRVGGEIGRRIDITVTNNLFKVDVDKDFLKPFREKTRKDASIGLGKLIEASVHFAACTKDGRVLELKRCIVDATLKTQGADGYIGCLAETERMWGLWDLPETGFIILGLMEDGRLCGEQRSLDAARKAADYVLAHWNTKPTGWGETYLREVPRRTGLCYALVRLSEATGDPRYRDFCLKTCKMAEWNAPIVFERRDLYDSHIYTYLDQCIVQLALYREFPADTRLLRASRRAVEFMTAQDGATITGGAGLWEGWSFNQDGRRGLAETCSTCYQIRVFENLLRLEGDAFYGDLMERTIYNMLFAAQEPNGRRIRYHTPMEGERPYFPIDTYCCPNNFRRLVSELPGMIYYASDKGVAVNLYSASEADLTVADGVKLRIRQETDYPATGHIVVTLDPEKQAIFPLKLRVPRWCVKPASIAINGQTWNGRIEPGRFASVERTWRKGDQVTLTLPMTWRVIAGRQRQSGRAAVMRGPQVYCMNPAAQTQFSESQRKGLAQDAADVGATIMIDPSTLADAPSDGIVRPGGTVGTVRASLSEGSMAITAKNPVLRLTEFPDPGGTLTYFRIPDPTLAEEDELFKGRAWRGEPQRAAVAPGAIRKILFLGNSITLHAPKPDIGWTNNWGMAASAPQKDFVHLVTRALSDYTGHEPQVMVRNIAHFERNYKTYDAATELPDVFAFEPDCVILAIGENVPALTTDMDMALFKMGVMTILDGVCVNKRPLLVVRNTFWSDGAKDRALRNICRDAGGIYVDLEAIGNDPGNYARSERAFTNDGVANHPGDKGMQRIAEAIGKAIIQQKQ
jgi:DUF1680 family protein